MTIRLIVIDDHDLVRAGLAQYFGMQPDIEVVAEAACCKELLGKLKTVQADILLLDMCMPGVDGKHMISLIKAFFPNLRILILSAHDEVHTVLDAMRAGASGYICKTCSPQTLLEAVKEVMTTGKYLARGMAEQLAYASLTTRPDNGELSNEKYVVNASPQHPRLTDPRLLPISSRPNLPT
jgi:DNA-binding NarL/FixJ family response regulator